MKPIIKVVLVLGAFFTTMLIITKATGLLNLQELEAYLTQLKGQGKWWVGPLISAMLFADLFIAVPTLSICIIAGYVLGFGQGFLFCMLGICMAGFAGYFLSMFYGEKFVKFIIRKEEEREEMNTTFNNYGVAIILLSRALPVLPEISACLAGMSKMKLLKFSLAWLAVNIPYVGIATFSGSVSTVDNPLPAIITAVVLTLFFWGSWWLFHRYNTKRKVEASVA